MFAPKHTRGSGQKIKEGPKLKQHGWGIMNVKGIIAGAALAVAAIGALTACGGTSVVVPGAQPAPAQTVTAQPTPAQTVIVQPAPARTVVVPAAPAAPAYACPIGYVCMYFPGSTLIENRYFNYGGYNLSGEVGMRVIVNNQTNGATITGWYGYNETGGAAWTILAGQQAEYDITPINSISLNS
jgi:hypothetical protein